MTKISAAGNAETAAFAVLRRMGFNLRALTEQPDPVVVAQMGAHEFQGSSAIEVLGLVAIFETRGENWHPNDDEVEQCVQFWSETHH